MVEYYSISDILSLREHGVILPAPDQVAIERSVVLSQISEGAILYPFSRLSGAKTKIYPQAEIGICGPAYIENSIIGSQAKIGNLGSVTLKDTVVGPRTVLGNGVAEQAVFLGKESTENDFTTGVGFRVRKGSLYEEDASSAQHTDTKMSILFPWVTLGSNVNLCDLFLSGGTGPSLGNFTEVGSGTIHFNFTIRGDKATGTLLGDVPRGVFLQQDRLFIGGNNTLIGPTQAEFGVMSAAGVRLSGTLSQGLHFGKKLPEGIKSYQSGIYSHPHATLQTQFTYIAHCIALFHWYQEIRIPLVEKDRELSTVYQAGKRIVELNIKERIKHVDSVMQALHESKRMAQTQGIASDQLVQEHESLIAKWPLQKENFLNYTSRQLPPPVFLEQLHSLATEPFQYTKTIQSLSQETVAIGIQWLQSIVTAYEKSN